MQLLDTVAIHTDKNDDFRLPVQYVSRPHLNFRGFCGTIASGKISVGDEITVLPSRKTSVVNPLYQMRLKIYDPLEKMKP